MNLDSLVEQTKTLCSASRGRKLTPQGRIAVQDACEALISLRDLDATGALDELTTQNLVDKLQSANNKLFLEMEASHV